MDGTSLDLSGKVAIVTGATKGIGYGLAMALARHGANIVQIASGQPRKSGDGGGRPCQFPLM